MSSPPSPSPSVADLFAAVIGQPAAVDALRAAIGRPVHAYLLAGPPGTGKRAAARAFAAGLLCAEGGCRDCVRCRRALAETDPDLVVVERQGASIAADQVDEVIRLAARAPAEGARKVLVLVDFHLVAQQYPRLLKTLEEPPASTVFVVLAEHVPAELATIASRCVRVDFGPVPAAAIAAALVASGVDSDTAARAAAASGGRVDRARLLASDPSFTARLETWRSIPSRLDGTGAAVAAAVDDVLAATDGVLEPLRARQVEEAAALKERIEAYGERGAGRRELEEGHRREQRRVRTDELRFGLAALAGAYRDRLAAGGGAGDAAAVAAVQAAGATLIRNPAEALLLAGLFCRLTTLTALAGRRT